MIIVYKNLDISGLLGMVGPRIRFARFAVGSIDAGRKVLLGRARPTSTSPVRVSTAYGVLQKHSKQPKKRKGCTTGEIEVGKNIEGTDDDK